MIRQVLKYTALGSVFIFAACSTPQYSDLANCKKVVNLEGVTDIARDGSGNLIVAVHNRKLVDTKGERLNTGRIGILQSRSMSFQEIELVGRDEYPFKPLGIDVWTEKNQRTLYVVNEAFDSQRSVEVFSLTANKAVFQRRIRSRQFARIRDVAATADDSFVLVREPARFWSSGDVVLYRSRKIRYTDWRIGGGWHVSKNDKGDVLIASRRGLMRVDWPKERIERLDIEAHVSTVMDVAESSKRMLLTGEHDQLFFVDQKAYRSPVVAGAFESFDDGRRVVFGDPSDGLTACELPAL